MAKIIKTGPVAGYKTTTLELSPEETEFLHRLLGNHTVGSPTGWRQYSTSIWNSLFMEYGHSKPLPTKGNEGFVKFEFC